MEAAVESVLFDFSLLDVRDGSSYCTSSRKEPESTDVIILNDNYLPFAVVTFFTITMSALLLQQLHNRQLKQSYQSIFTAKETKLATKEAR